MNTKIIYITGCLGFIGSYFTKKCLDLGWMVFGIDKVTYAANIDLLKDFAKYDNFKFLKEDIKNLNYLYDCDYVVNFAAESHVENSIAGSNQFVDTNILGVQNLLELIRGKHKNCLDRPVFIQISTDEVYGDIESGEHVETDILIPSNPYSATKASADMLVFAWSRTYDIEFNIIRPTNNYGIYQYPEKLIPLSVKNLNRGSKIKLHNDGEPVRNWLHADDTASAVLSVIQSNIKNEVFNVAGGFEQKNKDTVKKVIERYFDNKDTDWTNHVDCGYSRDGQDVRYALNDSKIRNATGWSPTKIFDDELDNIVKHYKDNFIW